MDDFISSLDHARNQIGEHTEAIRRVLTANAVPASSLHPISEIEHWIDTKLPDLRRRNQIAHATSNLPDWSPAGTLRLVPYKEDAASTSPAESRRLGTELADQYKQLHPDALLDPLLDQKYQKIIDALAEHVNDPEFTASFFATLGLEATMLLPVLARQRIGMQDGVGTVEPPSPNDKVLTTVSNAFATAVSAGSHIPGFAAIEEALRTHPMSRLDRFGTSLLVISGRFPAGWLAQVATVNGLTTGKPSAGFLHALGNNPTAARLALRLSTGDYTKDNTKLAALLTRFAGQTRGAYSDPEADAFGRMLAAAAGAYDEKDGAHSKDAATVAFTVMTTLGKVDLGQATRIHMSEIAGSYATEILEGANLGDTNHILDSSNTRVTSSLPGLKPSFRLSPEDTYHFLKTFTDTLANQAPFQAGMGLLTTRLINEAVPQMIKSKDPTRLDDTFGALGNVRGFELAARETWGNAQDQAAEESRQLASLLIGNAAGAVGLAFTGAGAVAYTALSSIWSYYDTTKAEPESEIDKIRATDARETLGRQHTIAQALLDAGFSPSISPKAYDITNQSGIKIAEQSGKLRPFSELIDLSTPGYDALDRWFIANGMGGNDSLALGQLTNRYADRFEGRKQRSMLRSLEFDR
ncbi:DUF6571 family protein [Sphaerisporangium aureirubrum]|uniref:DUF6571 family protein n=1 Tax=Sphaerisporangium aureirubrum TaxID=1544736 RepID=A0ABW1NVE5_9ACTN